MVAMAHTTTRKVWKKPFSRLIDDKRKDGTVCGYTGTVETDAGYVLVSAYRYENHAMKYLMLELIIGGYHYRRIYQDQFYGKRYAVTLARRMSDEMCIRNG